MYSISRNMPCNNNMSSFNTMVMPQQVGSVTQSLSHLPTGLPTGPTVAPTMLPCGASNLGPNNFPIEGFAPQTVMDVQYTQGYLKSQIGRRVKVEFLVGTNTFVDRTGVLVGVGASYILLRETESKNVVLGDLYSVRFVEFYN